MTDLIYWLNLKFRFSQENCQKGLISKILNNLKWRKNVTKKKILKRRVQLMFHDSFSFSSWAISCAAILSKSFRPWKFLWYQCKLKKSQIVKVHFLLNLSCHFFCIQIHYRVYFGEKICALTFAHSFYALKLCTFLHINTDCLSILKVL